MIANRKLHNGQLEIKLIGEIGPTLDVNVSDVSDLLDANQDRPVVLRINSPGGEVFESVAIYNAFRRHAKPVDVEIMAIAASGASVIAMAGRDITMLEGSQMMLHQAHGAVWGRADEIREYASLLDRLNIVIASVYAKRTGKSVNEMTALLARGDTFFGPQEAFSFGLATATEDRPAERPLSSILNNMAPSRRSLADCHKVLESVGDLYQSFDAGRQARAALLRDMELAEIDEHAGCYAA